MTPTDLVLSKIRDYLKDISPQAVQTLVRKLEKAQETGRKDPHADVILAVAVELLRKPDFLEPDLHDGVVRRNQVQRHFFSTLDEFLINERLPTRQEGRIYRPILGRVWRWLGRDILQGDIKMVLGEAEKPSVSDERIDNLVIGLRRRSVDAIGSALDKMPDSDRDRRRIAAEMGGERGLAELRDLYKIFAAEKWLVPLLNTMPDSLNENRFKRDMDVLGLVNKVDEVYPDHLPIVASALLERSTSPSALCAFAGRLAKSTDAKAIEASKYSTFVDAVLSEAERLNILAVEHRSHNPDPVAFSQALSEFHRLVQGVERDMDMSSAANWRGRLSTTKRSISEVVEQELRGAHGAVRRALQVPKVLPTGEVELDQRAVDDAVRAVKVVVLARNATQTLAVNDIGKRTRQTVEQTLEIVTRGLFSDIAKVNGPQLDAQFAAVDVAVMLCEIYYGPEYAAQLRRRRQSAKLAKEQQPEPPKPAKGRGLPPHVRRISA
ncbi:hypothetical protein JM93_01602 [Roseibium hamelinense]|uniref:Uncharacterized protein n=1 Tax=Roseibium hamelinense TaxID=150831 RepID=A0A562T750_9HYPH|nr:hypothetical protein [Roseibium hamelinense]TWI89399.1 hypothetical protein JM93_01602 [Roseibium hamelinense]